MDGSSGAALKPLGPEHAESLVALSAEAGWNQVAADWRFMLQHGQGLGMADAAGTWIATALTLPLGPAPLLDQHGADDQGMARQGHRHAPSAPLHRSGARGRRRRRARRHRVRPAGLSAAGLRRSFSADALAPRARAGRARGASRASASAASRRPSITRSPPTMRRGAPWSAARSSRISNAARPISPSSPRPRARSWASCSGARAASRIISGRSWPKAPRSRWPCARRRCPRPIRLSSWTCPTATRRCANGSRPRAPPRRAASCA